MKVLTTPYIVAVEYFAYGKTQTPIIQASLFVICVGAVITAVTDFQVNFTGPHRADRSNRPED
jgi:hypothetical protein